MKIKRCRRCGFPFWLGRLIRWNENGTITMLSNPDQRVVIIESDFLTNLFTLIQNHLGISIAHLVFEAQRNASVHIIDSQLSKFPYSTGRWGPNKRVVVKAFCHLAVWLGQSYAEAITYHPGRSSEAIVRNPYNRELMAAIILGAFESLERRPFEHTWNMLGDDDLISITPAEKRPEIAERLELEYPPLKDGDFFIPRCPSCGTPSELTYLEWRENEGVIMDTRRNARISFLDGYVPTIVFRELSREQGEEIYPLIIQAEKENTHRRIRELGIAGDKGAVLPRKERENIYESTLATLPIHGQGNPVDYDYSYEGLKVTVENPYDKHLLAGNMAALFEAAEGKEAQVDWDIPDPSSIIFTVRSSEQPGDQGHSVL
ncbi:MAG: hypothetical protein SWK76_12650 [Actinomycetota bacterium]|nr:hypothetical protein [Actinomycetota bacterium]